VQLPFVLNPTNRKTIQQLYGVKPSAWVGQCITLYPTTTEMAGATVDCIRVRPTVPGKAASAPRNKQGVTVARPASAPPAATNGADRSDADDSDAAADVEPEDTMNEDEPPLGALETDRTNDVIQ
jgi:hypothetical protein